MTNQWDLKYIHGLFIIREFVNAAKTVPEGSFIKYYYYLPSVCIRLRRNLLMWWGLMILDAISEQHYANIEGRNRFIDLMLRHGHVEKFITLFKRKDGSLFCASNNSQ